MPIDNLSTLTVFVLASMAIIAVPGPTITVIVANSLVAGARAGLLNVLGTQAGLLVLILVLAFGFDAVVTSLEPVFTVVRILGAAYLVYLGLKLWRAGGGTLNIHANGEKLTSSKYILQGFAVLLANPKALFFFGAFIPQFVDKSDPVMPQVLMLGLLFMLVGGVLDSLYALAGGKAGRWLTQSRVVWVERISGSFLFGGGLWLLTQGQR